MFGTMLFLHITGLVLWLGAFIAIIILLLLVNKLHGAPDAKNLAGRAVRVFNWLAQPSSIIVLISGILMIVEMNFAKGSKPLWILVMEMGGGTIVLISLILSTLLGRKQIKRLTASSSGGTAVAQGSGAYVFTLLLLALSIMAVIFVVSLRL